MSTSTDVRRVPIDPSSGRRASTQVARAVAETAGRSVEDLRPLGEVLEPDALDALFADDATALHVAFRYEGYEVLVSGRGYVELTPLDGAE